MSFAIVIYLNKWNLINIYTERIRKPVQVITIVSIRVWQQIDIIIYLAIILLHMLLLCIAI